MHQRLIAHVVVVAAAAVTLAASGAFAQQSLERFDRQLELIRRETDARALSDVPVNQRALVDYGGFLSFNYFSIDDTALDNHVLRQYEVIGYLRINLDAAQEIYLRGRTGWQDFNDGDSFDGRGDERIDADLDRGFYRFDSQGYQRSRGQPVSDLGVRFEAGRDLVYWGNGLTISQPLDGVITDFSWRDTTLQVIAGITPVRTVDIDPSRPNFESNTRRGFYGVNVAHQVGQHRPYVYGLVQRDYNDDDVATTGGVVTEFDYNSYYLGAGVGGAITDRLLYGVEVVYEGGTTLSNSFIVSGPVLTQIPQTEDDISAWAADARVDFLLLDRRRSRLSAEVIVASGDDDRLQTSSTFGGNAPNTTDHAFNAFGLLNTGLAFAPAVSNILIVRAGALTFPMPEHSAFDKLQVGVDCFVYNKLDSGASIDEPTFDRGYLGFEPDFFLNWQISSDVTLALRYGIFFPGSAIVADDDPRHFIGAGVTYAF
jgi:hypothetical protein